MTTSKTDAAGQHTDQHRHRKALTFGLGLDLGLLLVIGVEDRIDIHLRIKSRGIK